MRVTGSTFLIVPFFEGHVKNVMLSPPSALQTLENSRLNLRACGRFFFGGPVVVGAPAEQEANINTRCASWAGLPAGTLTSAQWLSRRRPLRCTFLTSTCTEGRGRWAGSSVLLKRVKGEPAAASQPERRVTFRARALRLVSVAPSSGSSLCRRQSELTNQHSAPSQPIKMLRCRCPAP